MTIPSECKNIIISIVVIRKHTYKNFIAMLVYIILIVIGVLIYCLYKHIKKEKNASDSDELLIISICFFCALICVGIFIIGGIFSFLLSDLVFSETTNYATRKSLFGQSFGAVEALISGLAFSGVIVSIYYQRAQLKLQRKEFSENNNELSAQCEELKQNNRNLALQRFENDLFNMLTLQQQIINDIKIIENNKIVANGRDSFEYSFEKENRIGMRGTLKNKAFRINSFVIDTKSAHYDHYFLHLYTILKFIDNNDILTADQKRTHANYLKSTLSRYELIWLFYYGLSVNGLKIKPLIEQYSMLEYIEKDLLQFDENFDDFNYVVETLENAKKVYTIVYSNEGKGKILINELAIGDWKLSKENAMMKYNEVAYGIETHKDC